MCPDSKSKRYHHSVSEHLQSVVGKAISTEDSKYQPCNMIKGSGREAVGHSFDSKSPPTYELEVRCPGGYDSAETNSEFKCIGQKCESRSSYVRCNGIRSWLINSRCHRNKVEQNELINS